jgi:hypothetical protein
LFLFRWNTAPASPFRRDGRDNDDADSRDLDKIEAFSK